MLGLFIGFCLVICSIVIFFVLWPWLEHRLEKTQTESQALSTYQQLIQEREFLLENLKELELDYQMQKIELADYERLRHQLMQKTARIFSKIDEWEKSSPLFQNVSQDAMGTTQ